MILNSKLSTSFKTKFVHRIGSPITYKKLQFVIFLLFKCQKHGELAILSRESNFGFFRILDFALPVFLKAALPLPVLHAVNLP